MISTLTPDPQAFLIQSWALISAVGLGMSRPPTFNNHHPIMSWQVSINFRRATYACRATFLPSVTDRVASRLSFVEIATCALSMPFCPAPPPPPNKQDIAKRRLLS